MSFNDRCAEAYSVLHHGGTIPTDHPAIRDALMEWLLTGYEIGGGPDNDLVHAIRDDPANAEIWQRIRTGDLPCIYDEGWPEAEGSED